MKARDIPNCWGAHCILKKDKVIFIIFWQQICTNTLFAYNEFQ